MRWVLELVISAWILGLVFAMYNYTSPSSVAVQASERGRFAELSTFAVRLASSPDFLFKLQEDWSGAVEQAQREVRSIDPLASVNVTRPAGDICQPLPAPRFSIAVATVLPNGTAVCVVVWG